MLLLELAQERSIDAALDKLLSRAVQRPDLVCMQVWLVEGNQGEERPPTGNLKADNPEEGRWLRMFAGIGKDLNGNLVRGKPYFDRDCCVEMGGGLLGRVAATGQSEVERGVEGVADELGGAEWVRQQARSCGATAIQYKGEVLGVMAGFSTEPELAETPMWGRIFADHIGAAIANARAFEEIERLRAQVELQNVYLKEEIEEAKAFGCLVGRSEALRQTISQIDLVAPTEASVLILGETGTGKELVAHEIHRRSGRKEKPLVRVNCASIPRDLYESEFFGHVRGAFTGALRDRAGRFEAAEGGTLFLDEVGEIPLELQGKLLRVLQEKRYERVGEERSRTADVRIIGATNRDLKGDVAAGRFRQDLFYRLHVFPIEVVPLRERLEDVPLLAEHFVEMSVRELRCARPRLTRENVAQLQRYDWPGNVRELRNVIQRAVILARGGALRFDLPGRSRGGREKPEVKHPKSGKREESRDNLSAAGAGEYGLAPAGLQDPGRDNPASGISNQAEGGKGFLTEAELRERERANLLSVLELTGWRVMGKNGAAELLGVKATTLFSRMRKWGLEKPPGI